MEIILSPNKTVPEILEKLFTLPVKTPEKTGDESLNELAEQTNDAAEAKVESEKRIDSAELSASDKTIRLVLDEQGGEGLKNEFTSPPKMVMKPRDIFTPPPKDAGALFSGKISNLILSRYGKGSLTENYCEEKISKEKKI